MPGTSSVPAVKSAIFTLLQTALPTTQVLWANSADFTRESAWLGQAEFDEESVATLRAAPHPKQEKYRIPVVVFALGEGNDAQATELRAWTMAGAFESALRTTDTLAVTGVQNALIVRKQPALYHPDNGWEAFVDMLVEVNARI